MVSQDTLQPYLHEHDALVYPHTPISPQRFLSVISHEHPGNSGNPIHVPEGQKSPYHVFGSHPTMIRGMQRWSQILSRNAEKLLRVFSLSELGAVKAFS